MKDVIIQEQIHNCTHKAMSAVFLTPETYLARTIIFKGKERLVNGMADYTTWYGNGAMDTNMVVVDVLVFRASVGYVVRSSGGKEDLVKYRNCLAHGGNIVEDVEAKRNGLAQSGIAQCLAYIGIALYPKRCKKKPIPLVVFRHCCRDPQRSGPQKCRYLQLCD